MAADYRGRFAPSPTGPLHFGSLVAALGSWLRARAQGGAWLVRVEDIDPLREVPGAAQDQLRTLAAFGLVPDEPVLYQSRRAPAHEAALERLQSAALAYPCRCSRSDLAPHGGRHPAGCVARDPRRKPAWRLRTGVDEVCFDDLVQGPKCFEPQGLGGDFVVWRVEGWPAYHLAVVVDDAFQRITEVVRGSDLLDSTPRQVLVQRALGLPTPAYAHLPLVADARGRKLGKSTAALPVDADDPLPALRLALRFLGQPVPARGDIDGMLSAAAAGFDLEQVPRAAPPPHGGHGPATGNG